MGLTGLCNSWMLPCRRWLIDEYSQVNQRGYFSSKVYRKLSLSVADQSVQMDAVNVYKIKILNREPLSSCRDKPTLHKKVNQDYI